MRIRNEDTGNWNEELGIRNFLGTDGHGFKKDTAGCAMGKALFVLRLY